MRGAKSPSAIFDTRERGGAQVMGKTKRWEQDAVNAINALDF